MSSTQTLTETARFKTLIYSTVPLNEHLVYALTAHGVKGEQLECEVVVLASHIWIDDIDYFYAVGILDGGCGTVNAYSPDGFKLLVLSEKQNDMEQAQAVVEVLGIPYEEKVDVSRTCNAYGLYGIIVTPKAMPEWFSLERRTQ